MRNVSGLVMAFLLAISVLSVIDLTVSQDREFSVVEVITDSDFYYVGETVNITVEMRVYCLCLYHKWRVYILDYENRTVSWWSWSAKCGEEGFRGRMLTWTPSTSGHYTIIAELVDHGIGSKGVLVFDREYADRWVWTDKEKYMPGEIVEIYLHNAGNQTLDGRVDLWIARYENGSWLLVYEIHAYILLYWTPCYVLNLTWNQLDMDGKPVPLGRYRIIWSPYVNEVPIGLYTCEFRIVSPENPKVYLILVESEIYWDIYAEVDQYRREFIENHGILAYLKRVSRYASAETLRRYLNRVYNYYLKHGCDFLGAVFVGDLPYMLFEVENPWSFRIEMNKTYKLPFLGSEVFPCDLYFMDLDGAWTDSDGDGVLDIHDGDVRPEIFIGRVSPKTLLRSTKINYIKRYLQKLLSYWRGEIPIQSRALVYIDDDWESWAEIWTEACGKAFNETTLICGGWKTNAWDYAWRLGDGWEGSSFVHVAVHGSSQIHAFGSGGTGSQGILTSGDISSINPKPLFYILFSCSNARYTSERYIAGQYVWGDYGLLSISSTKVGGMLYYDYFYTPLGEGYCFGESLRRWFIWVLDNEPMGEKGTKAWFYGITIIGDPLLTLNPPSFVTNINITALSEYLPPAEEGIFEFQIPLEMTAENGLVEVNWGSANGTYLILSTNQSLFNVELEVVDVPSGLDVELNPQIFNLTANQEARVKVTFKANRDLKPGVYDLTILAKTNDTLREETFSVMVHTRDIAIVNITFSKRKLAMKETIQLYVTLENRGTLTETFNVSVNYALLADPLIGTQAVTLQPGATVTLNFTWTPTQAGRYEIRAYTSTIQEDINPTDNMQIAYIFVSSGGSNIAGEGGFYRLI